METTASLPQIYNLLLEIWRIFKRMEAELRKHRSPKVSTGAQTAIQSTSTSSSVEIDEPMIEIIQVDSDSDVESK